ncbi:hypothetical protein KDD30_07780 [Photobacterium sp. GJ3]|uniref:hypothetical protein n=1 Tax=Photobacterium sp. GJ3 TaxID=2829502 RepID=UPI001B8AEDE4|nr:hypothetical protein [Photobacterium sp. GJ3]QUJ68955.1 hypothetical protein KDD30_07780 [Photobacterium sp. GJ3]
MSHLSSGTSRSTLEALIDGFSHKDYQGFQLEVWVFADHPTRLAAEKKLRQLGIEARIFSAYKPLVHFFLESFSFEQYPSQSIEIGYPVSPHASEKRFLLEAYPLGAMLKDKPLRFFPDETCSDCYSVTFCNELDESKTVTVFAPNHVSSSITGEESLSPTGWIKLYNPQGECLRDERLATDYEKVFQALMNVVQSYPWPEKPPYFERLCVRVAIPVKDEPVGYEHEVMSLKEALHEDLYFSIQEWFKFREGKCKTERNSQPGQIIPFICHSSHQGYDYDLDIEPYPFFIPESELQPLDKAFQPLSPGKSVWRSQQSRAGPLRPRQ